MKKVREFNEIPKQQIIRAIQNNMSDAEGTQDYLETLNRDELKTLLTNFILK